jgi:hypothetical protein
MCREDEALASPVETARARCTAGRDGDQRRLSSEVENITGTSDSTRPNEAWK